MTYLYYSAYEINLVCWDQYQKFCEVRDPYVAGAYGMGKEASTAGVLIDWLHTRKGLGQLKVRKFRFIL